MCRNLKSKDWQMVGAIKAKTTMAPRSPVEQRGGRRWMGQNARRGVRVDLWI